MELVGNKFYEHLRHDKMNGWNEIMKLNWIINMKANVGSIYL